MRVTCALLGVLLAAGLAGAFGPADLDVDVPSGNPSDTLKMPTSTPTGGTRASVESKGTTYKPATPVPAPGSGSPGAGMTVAEDPKKKPPPKPPMGLPGITAPSTVDWPNHLKWSPNDKNVLRSF